MLSHAAILLVHQRPEQVDWLIDLLNQQGVAVAVHADAKSHALFAGLRKRYDGVRDVHFVERPVRVNWGGLSQILATLAGIRCLLDRDALAPDGFIHLMSGECLPLVPFTRIDEAARALPPDTDLIESDPCGAYAWRVNRYCILSEHPKNRSHYYDRAFCLVRDLQRNLPTRRNFAAEELRIGSQWWSLSRRSVERMLSEDVTDWLRRFRWTRSSDEHFFQMLHLRVGLHAAGNRRYIDFPPGASSPKLLELEELNAARASGALFARKVPYSVAANYVRSCL